MSSAEPRPDLTDPTLRPDATSEPTANGHPGANGKAAADAARGGRGGGRGDKPDKSKDSRQFWRAAGHLWPYRRVIAVSIVCAVFVGLAVSGGLTTMLPILRVLVSGQTVATWADGQIAQRRLDVKLADAGKTLQVLSVSSDSPVRDAGLAKGDRIALPGAPAGSEGVAQTVRALADPAVTSVTLARDRGGPVTLPLPPLPQYLAAARGVAHRASPHPVWAIAQIFGILAVVATVGNALKFAQEYLSDKAAVGAVNDIRRRMYDRVLHVPLSHFGGRNTSDVTSRLVQDAMALEAGFKTVLGQTIQQPIVIVMALGLAFWANWKLTLVMAVCVPVLGAFVQKIGKRMRRASRSALQQYSAVLGQIRSSIAGLRVVKGACAERFERRRYRGILHKLVAQQLRMSRIEAFTSPTMETLTLLIVGGVVLVATYMVTEARTLSVERFFLVMACLGTIGDCVRRLSKVNNTLQVANAAAVRIFEVIDLPVERERGRGQRSEVRGQAGNGVAAPLGTGDGGEGQRTKDKGPATAAPPAAPRRLLKLRPLQRDVRFDRVTFTYPGAPAPAVVDVSLTVPKGQSVAIVGRNGSGKTTLLGLLPRLYDPDSGRILIDGVDVRNAALRSLRGQISVVTQESVIFPATIAENIAYGQPRATRDEIEAAARRAFAHDFIAEKPQGYDTRLGELGGQLSGGQRQRLCIARAILRNAPILVLDEATSQVDAESEHLIQQAVDGLLHQSADGTGARPTTFVIAHRFSTILGADTIVVMDRGRIVGQGTHDDLLRTCETYRQLCERQLVGA